MAVATRSDEMNGGGLTSQRISGRLIPQRGQVKLGIVVGLFRSFSSVMSLTARCVHLP